MAKDGGGKVAIVMGSQSDWPTMRCAAEVLEELEVEHEARIVSAHRTPDRMSAFAKGAEGEGFDVIIAGAGGAAHLPGMIAAMTHLPVLGVPVQSKALSGMDSLLSIAQMPAGVPVGTLAIGEAGATNAGLMAAAILALQDEDLSQRLQDWRAARSNAVGEVPVDDQAAGFAPGGDAKAISQIATEHFGGYTEMFEAHDWPERGSDMMRKVQTRVADQYGSVAAFVEKFPIGKR
ncbi:hypothetical protein MACH05_02660 [Qipengyuania nanhaisediminis]